MRFLTHVVLLLLFIQSCTPEGGTPPYLVAEGKTMGTYYKVTYEDSLKRDFSQEIDALLIAINHEISTYEPNSTISQFNNATGKFNTGLMYRDYASCLSDYRTCPRAKNRHFHANFLMAKVAHERTHHLFDPTVMSLVNYWGFGYTPKQAVTQVDSLKIDSLMQYVGFDKVKMIDENGYAVIVKDDPNIKIDFGGTGQGYGIDAVSEFLENKGIKNYLVDIGGEERARGKNARGGWWRIGINTPSSDAAVTDFTQIIELRNMSVSTSGNYRNFYEVDGKKYSHFISPVTGFPEKRNLLSASLFSENCTYPDALATGFMLMEVDEAVTLAEQLKDIEGLFIYSDENGEMKVKYTSGVADFLVSE
jgi:thiamine biosynthesis lipoprotein